ncbi:unnamed protein product [Acanthoscelides obtectus]|uniref:HMG box domain-containing protein n=1 Tax=Acanthoscelides obtectus TaxID=200917 RepID=A0A9P0JNY5_ACAOB|nr:unnamed protein product [Acanthoscelides obtectus]CAK1673877.1 hypothetical protein AOBTE_LOCUS29464 [Acanthoscelides obtectus]
MSILENQIGQAFQPYIVLTGVKFEHLRYIIEFMYSGETKVLDKDIEDVLKLGEKFQVKGLCSVKLREKVSVNFPGQLSKNSKEIPEPANPLCIQNAVTGTPTVVEQNPTLKVPCVTKLPPHKLSTTSSTTTEKAISAISPLANTCARYVQILPKLPIEKPGCSQNASNNVESPTFSSQQENTVNARTVSKAVEPSKDVDASKKMVGPLGPLIMKGKQILLSKDQLNEHYEVLHTDIKYDSPKTKPAIKKYVGKQTPLAKSPNEFDHADTASSSNSCKNVTVENNIPAAKVILKEDIKSKTSEGQNKSPDSAGSFMENPANSRVIKSEPTSPAEVDDKEVLLSDTSSFTMETGDEAMVVIKEEIQDDEVSNRSSLIKDTMEVMKNGTQVPRKALEIEHKPVSPFMLFANEWRGMIATEYPDESKREISLRISHMWKSLEPDNRKAYYKRARRSFKVGSTSPQPHKRSKQQDERTESTVQAKISGNFEIVTCGDEDS